MNLSGHSAPLSKNKSPSAFPHVDGFILTVTTLFRSFRGSSLSRLFLSTGCVRKSRCFYPPMELLCIFPWFSTCNLSFVCISCYLNGKLHALCTQQLLNKYKWKDPEMALRGILPADVLAQVQTQILGVALFSALKNVHQQSNDGIDTHTTQSMDCYICKHV